jgi:hypothetical protein
VHRLKITLPLLALALAACPPPPPKVTEGEGIAPKDEWDSIPRTPEWLHATAGFNGSRKAECEEVLGWVKGEAVCKGAICAHGRDLSREWIPRCEKLTPAGVEEVKALRDKFTASAEEAPTECATQATSILNEGCGKADATCERGAQAWATRCGKTDATPLLVRALERSVRRKMEDGGEFALDLRNCDELRAFMAEGTSCAQQFACEDMLRRVEMVRARCQGQDRPVLATAFAELAITAGALKTSPPIPVQPSPARLSPGDTPVPFADASGGALLVCGERPTDLAKYLAQRKGCEGGAVVLGKVFIRVREVDVRMGSFESPSDAIFAQRFPSLGMAGEREARDKEVIAVLDAAIGKAAALGQEGRTLEGAFELFKGVMAHAGAIQRSAPIRAALAGRDDAVAPALRELGKAKVAVSSRGLLAGNDFVVFVNRALARPFGDFSPEFSVQQGAATRGVTLETGSFWPKATEAYLDALKNVAREASRKKLDAKFHHDAVVKGYDDAKICGEAEKAHRDAEQGLIRCGFGVDVCDPAKIAALTKASDDARATIEQAYIRLHLAISGPAAGAKGEVEQAMLARECEAPWW